MPELLLSVAVLLLSVAVLLLLLGSVPALELPEAAALLPESEEPAPSTELELEPEPELEVAGDVAADAGVVPSAAVCALACIRVLISPCAV